MLLPPEQRRLLGAFLRARREALTPAAVGQPETGRRRTPGLRREEVAQLCGISPTWYVWVEQGRDISLSAAALGRLADGLRMSPAERAYLFELTRRRDPAPPEPEALPAVPWELEAMLRATTAPSYLLDRLWRARAWNKAALHLFAGWLCGTEPCLLRYVFLDSGSRSFIADWESRARRLLAEFRADLARAPEDEELRALVEGLRRDSPDFARFWNTQSVLAREGGARIFNHPEDGRLHYEQVTLLPATHPDHKIVVLLPSPG